MTTYTTEGVCAKKISFHIKEDILEDVTFHSGCPGNLEGIRRLVKGMQVNEVIRKLKGIDCEGKGTSCADQLAKALETIVNENNI